MIDELPSGYTGDMVPVMLPTIGVGMVPIGVAGISAADDIALVDGGGTGAAAIVGGGGAGIAGGGGAGTVVPGIVDRNDVAGCADSVSIGAVVLFVDVDEVAGTADIVVTAETDGIVPIVPPSADMDVTGTAAVPGAICPVGVEQVTTVPGVVGFVASGTGASVVSGAPGGEVTIVPGVDESPMAVVPMVETCARLALQAASRMAVVNSKRRIAIASSLRI